MNLKELLNGIKDVIIEALTSGKSVEDTLNELNEAWPAHIDKIETIVEAISNERADDIAEDAKVKAAEDLKEKFDEMTKTLSERNESYLNEAYEKFVKDFQSSLISEAKVELVESFVGKLKETFNENSIDVDMDTKNDTVELSEKVKDLEDKLNESMNEKMELEKELKSKDYKLAFESVVHEHKLTETQIARLNKMVDAVALSESGDPEKTTEKLNFLVKTVIVESKEDGENNADSKLNGVINEDATNAASQEDDKNENLNEDKGEDKPFLADPLADGFLSC